MGTALIGAVVISSLVGAFVDNIGANEQIDPELTAAIEVDVAAGANFVAADDLDTAFREAGLDNAQTSAVIADYEDAQLRALKTGLLFAGILALLSLSLTKNLPAGTPHGEDDEPAPVTA